MGLRLAMEARARGHHVTVVAGPIQESFPRGVTVVPVERTRQMAHALRRLAPRADVVIMAAAVADFQVARPSASKRAKRAQTLRLRPTPDVIAALPRRARQLVVGFALETARAVASATEKLREKRLDLIVAQDAGRASPFGRRRVTAWVVQRDGRTTALGTVSKAAVARALLDKVEALWYGQVAHGTFTSQARRGVTQPHVT